MKMTPTNDKKGGVVTGTVLGVGGLIISVIILFVVIGTVWDADLLPEKTLTVTVTNEAGGHANITGYTLSGYNSTWSSMTLTGTWNETDGTVIPFATNITLSAVGVMTNTTSVAYEAVNVSYTYVHTYSEEDRQMTQTLRANLSDGTEEISQKVPTILLIVAVVFLFGALVLLIGQARRMGVFGGGGSSL